MNRTIQRTAQRSAAAQRCSAALQGAQRAREAGRQHVHQERAGARPEGKEMPAVERSIFPEQEALRFC